MKLIPLNENDPVFYVTKKDILESHWPFWEQLQKAKGNEPDYSQKVDQELCVMHWCEMLFSGTNQNHVGRDSSPHTFNVTFWDDEEHTVYTFFKNWKESC